MTSVLVVAHYNENIDWLHQVSIPVCVYHKGTDLPNIGREAHTYLTYIVEHYHELPDKVFFTQGDPFSHSPSFFQHLQQSLYRPFEFVSLGTIDTELIEHSKSHPGIEKALHDCLIDLIGHCPTTIFFPVGALFGYSKTFIQRHPLSYWKDILQKCIDSEKTLNCIDEHYHQKQPCGCLNSYSPWCLERLWFYL